MKHNEIELLLIDTLKINQVIDPLRFTQLSSEDWQKLLSLAADQQVAQLFWHRCRKKGLDSSLPPDMTSALRESIKRNTILNLRNYGELKKVLSVLNNTKTSVILLKGIYLADKVYETITLREMGDIDLMVRSQDLETIAEVLKGMEYNPARSDPANMNLKIGHHLRLLKSGAAPIEVHWNLLDHDETGYVEPDVFWENTVTVRITDCDALTLTPPYLLLHLCYHTSYHHQFAFGLRPSCDIAAVIDHFGELIDWQSVVTKAKEMQWHRGVYLALRLAKDLADAEVPEDVLAKLRPENFPDTLLFLARTQIFSDKKSTNAIPNHLANLLGNGNFFNKWRIFWKRVFLPKCMIASIYEVSPDSIRIYAYYPYRVIDLLSRHGHSLKKHLEGNPEVTGIVERKNLIAHWLAERIASQ